MKPVPSPHKLLWLGLTLLASASAQTVVHTNTANRGYQASGPANNQNYLIVEGTNNGSFAGFVAIDFSFSAANFGASAIGGVSSVSLSLVKDDFAYAVGGPVNVYLAANTTTALTTGTLTFNNTFSEGLATTGGIFGDLYLLGSASITQASNNSTDGVTDTLTFAPTGAAATFLVDQINTGNNVVRVIVTPGSTGTAVAWAGLTHLSLADPSLSITAVPEPSAYAALLGLFALAIGLVRSRWKPVSTPGASAR